MVKHRIIFVGRMSYYPNIEAVLFFCRYVFPKIRKSFPHAQFRIVGSNPPRIVKSLSKLEGVKVTGYVDDIRPYLFSSSVSIAPLKMATGVQLKVTQAMAAGVPVVATSLICKHMGASPNINILCADDSEVFVNQIEKLFVNYQLREKIINNAKRFINDKFDHRINTKYLINVYKNAINSFN